MGIGEIKLTIEMKYVHCQQVFCDEKVFNFPHTAKSDKPTLDVSFRQGCVGSKK